MNNDGRELVDYDRHLITDVGEEILATYNLMLVGPRDTPSPQTVWRFVDAIHEAEENLTDLLPSGYRCVIKEWSSDE